MQCSRESNSTAELNTDVNLCGVVQYIDTAAQELQLIECALYTISSKADRGDIFIVHDQKSSYRTPLPSAEIADRGTGAKGHFSVGPQRGRKGF